MRNLKALAEVLLEAREMPPTDEVVVLTGVVLPGSSAETFILQRHGDSRLPRAEFRCEDVIGEPLALEPAQVETRDLGAVIHALRVRRGATAQVIHEETFQVGTDPYPEFVLDEYNIGGDASPASAPVSLATILQSAPAVEDQPYVAFPGSIVRGPTADTFGLLLAPWDASSLGMVRIADVVEPEAVAELPVSAVPIAAYGRPVYLVKIRHGAKITTTWRSASQVLHAPITKPPCGCGGETGGCAGEGGRSGKEHGSGRDPQLAGIGGASCKEVSGTCPSGKLGYVCSNEGTYCGWWFGSEYCTTVASYWWGCKCSCT